MLGLSIKLSPTPSSTASSHFATASACARSTNYMGLNAFPKRTMSLSASPCPLLNSLCRRGIFDCQCFGLYPLSASLSCLSPLQLPLLKMLMLPFLLGFQQDAVNKGWAGTWEPRCHGAKERRFIWLSFHWHSQPRKQWTSSRGGRRGSHFFFFFKLKPTKKGKCCPCNFGRDFQLPLSLSERQNSSSMLGGQRRRAMAQKMESARS